MMLGLAKLAQGIKYLNDGNKGLSFLTIVFNNRID